ncbi:hypothetical protein CGC58_07350 [Capnocytophaga stomatis]|uniref:SusD-like N-terminal domain-containing protein n=1 Tax=Capnocytophaga stomatis TaxID=1848904 RepID=A0A250FWM4_9FLAO|nr:RagB/SusD family nutrient uptake outer membrane protein [Capnocytophaga stomatis]ATA89559.1 hypothetical protein CGC58_07350 [Capnocytophaga stomatis]
MKKIALILSVVISLFASCSKELDLPSQASLSANAPLSSEDVDKLLNGLYTAVQKPNDYGYFNIMMTEIMGDNFKPYKFQWFQVKNLYEKTIPTKDILLSYQYRDYYKGISRANTILNVPTATDAQKGQARYCRALTYLRLFDIYERVPLVDENYKGEPIAASTKEAVLDFILEDLKFAKEYSPELDRKNLEQAQKFPTKEAAMALLARVYRVRGNIAAATAEAEALITLGKFSLADNPLERTSEVIFRFAGNKAEENGDWGWIMSWEARNWNCFGAADELTALIKGEDTRKALFDFENSADRNGYVFSKKYKTESNSDLLISRIAEMYLISAEGGNTNRLTELQAVRKSSLSLDDERRLEMSFEWTRWQDLKLKGIENYVPPYPEGALNANTLLGK